MELATQFFTAVNDLRALKSRDLALFVLRHAESLGQKEQAAYKRLGDGNLPLTDLGVLQARAAGEILSSLCEGARLNNLQLISSTGHRSTRTTIEIFNEMAQRRKDLYVNFDARLDKQKFGRFDGLFTRAERQAACPAETDIFYRDKQTQGIFHARPPGGESIADVQARMAPFFEERRSRGGGTIVVTHGTNALCLEDIPLRRGVAWIEERLDTRPNCAIRMITGNDDDGYKARTICTDPIATRRALLLQEEQLELMPLPYAQRPAFSPKP